MNTALFSGSDLDVVFSLVLTMSLSASWIAAAVLVLRLCLKRAPKWVNVLLWGIVAVRLVLPAVRELLRPGAPAVCLIKPQFEAGREDVGKKGVVRDSAVHERVLREFLDFAPGAGYTVMGLDFSPVRGPEGNIEYLAYLKKGAFEAPIPDAAAVVAASHRELAK